jgi:hypothetical protein
MSTSAHSHRLQQCRWCKRFLLATGFSPLSNGVGKVELPYGVLSAEALRTVLIFLHVIHH